MAKEKVRIEKKSNLEDMLANLLAKVDRLESERQESPVKRKPTSKPKFVKRIVDGTGSVFWSVQKPMIIRQADADTGRYYKSMDGKRVRVFFVNKNFPQAPIVGAIEIQPGIWDARVWNSDGGMRVPYGYSSNIVGFWEE